MDELLVPLQALRLRGDLWREKNQILAEPSRPRGDTAPRLAPGPIQRNTGPREPNVEQAWVKEVPAASFHCGCSSRVKMGSSSSRKNLFSTSVTSSMKLSLMRSLTLRASRRNSSISTLIRDLAPFLR